MSAAWIKAWFTFATVYTCIALSKEISEQFFACASGPNLSAPSSWSPLLGLHAPN